MFLIILGVLASAGISQLTAQIHVPQFLLYYNSPYINGLPVPFFINLDANNLTLFFSMVLTYLNILSAGIGEICIDICTFDPPKM